MPPSVGEAPKGVGILLDDALEGVADDGVGEAAVFARTEVDFVPDFGAAGWGGGGWGGFFDAAGLAVDGFAAGDFRGFGAGFGGDAFFGDGAGLLLFAGVDGFADFFSGFFGAGAFTAFGGFAGGFAAAFFP